MFTEFELEKAKKIGNQFKVFCRTNWEVLRTFDVRNLTESLQENIKLAEGKIRSIQKDKETK